MYFIAQKKRLDVLITTQKKTHFDGPFWNKLDLTVGGVKKIGPFSPFFLIEKPNIFGQVLLTKKLVIAKTV